MKTAPHHPSSNGQSEHAVQVFKNGYKMKEGAISDHSARFLFAYRITPHSTTGSSPAELMFGRNLHSRLHKVQPNVSERVEAHQENQKSAHDDHAHNQPLEVGKPVFVRNFRPGQPWIPGHIVRLSGPVSFEVQLMNG